MERYDTPIKLARVLAEHVPTNARRILEPSVGTGILLEPIIAQSDQITEIVCIDIDKQILGKVEQRFQSTLGKKLETFHADFLSWSSANLAAKKYRSFDCVIMNPPFSGRAQDQVKIDLDKEFPSFGKGPRLVPLEGAFILRAIRLLNSGGKLLAILPSSIISAIKNIWFRDLINSLGAIQYVHEFPKRTFKGLDAMVYLFVFQKDRNQENVTLISHNLNGISTPSIKKTLKTFNRFDYQFHFVHNWYTNLLVSQPNLEWVQLRDVAKILRGKIKTPFKTLRAIHTCDYQDGFWHRKNGDEMISQGNSEQSIHKGDILVKRVSRKCAQTVGLVLGHEDYAVSDCVLILRPQKVEMGLEILFSLRFLIAFNLGACLLERGTGATYLTESDLRELLIPIGLAKEHACLFKQYQTAISLQNFEQMKEIENHLRLQYLPARLGKLP